MRTSLPLAYAIVIGSLVATGLHAAGYAPRVGEQHPDFTLPDIRTGRPVSLADFQGKRVLLIQFASW